MSEHHHHHHHHGIPEKATPEALKRIRWALYLNMSFAVVELIGGLAVNSLAILSGALHDLGDSLALGLAYYLEKHSHQKSDGKYSYGYRRFSALAALVTGTILVVGSAFILIETLPRIWSPHPTPNAQGMMGLAVLGLVVNGFAAFRVSKGSSLNEKMLVWHLLEDIVSWAVVLIGGIILNFWEVPWLDPVLALILSVWVVRNVMRNLKETFQVFLQAVPENIDVEKLKEKIIKLEYVQDIHHVHVWSLDGEAHVLTAHVSLQSGLSLVQWDLVKAKVKHLLLHEGLSESTLEFEDQSQTCSDPSHGSNKL